MIGLPAVRVVTDSIDLSFRLLPASAKLSVTARRASVATAVDAKRQTCLHFNMATLIMLVPSVRPPKQQVNRHPVSVPNRILSIRIGAVSEYDDIDVC
jgi:hypothetical protein